MTAPHEIVDERSHEKVASGFAAISMASTDSTNEATSPRMLLRSISM